MVKYIIKIFFFKDTYFIYLLLISFLNRVLLLDKCIIESFPELKYPKSETLLNGYILMIITTGIYSFNLLNSMTKFEYSYNFTQQQILSEDEIFKAQISQFLNLDEEKDYALIYVRNFIYVLTNKGEVLFYENLDISYENISFISLIAYEYKYPSYYFFLIYIAQEDKIYSDFINNYRLTFKSEEEHEITLFYNNTFVPIEDLIGDYYGGLSSEIMMTQESSKNKIVCFFAISSTNYLFNIIALEIDPNTFSVTNSGATSGAQLLYLSSSVGEDKSKALVCYVNIPGNANCYYYDFNEKKFSENFLFHVGCTPEIYSMNLYYFPQSKEYIFSCYDHSHYLNFRKLNNDFDLIHTNLTYEDQKYFGCYNYLSFSIFYLLNIKQYITIAHCKCDEVFNIRLFLILDDCSDFNETQLYIKKENTLDTFNIKELNGSEYIIRTNENLQDTDNYEQSKSEKLVDTVTIPYLTDSKHTESNNLYIITDYSTEKIEK